MVSSVSTDVVQVVVQVEFTDVEHVEVHVVVLLVEVEQVEVHVVVLFVDVEQVEVQVELVSHVSVVRVPDVVVTVVVGSITI